MTGEDPRTTRSGARLFLFDHASSPSNTGHSSLAFSDGRYSTRGGISLKASRSKSPAATGRPVKYVAESAEQAQTRMAREGAAPWEIEGALALAAYQSAGGPTAVVSTAVPDILGRPARDLQRFMAENARAFGG